MTGRQTDKGSKQGLACLLKNKFRIGKKRYKYLRNINCDNLGHWKSTQLYNPNIDINFKGIIIFYKISTKLQLLIGSYLIKRERYSLSMEPEQGLACSISMTESIQYLKNLYLKFITS